MNLRILKRIIKNYFTFTRSERYGTIFLCSILLIVMVVNFTVNFSSKDPVMDFTEYKKAMEKWDAENSPGMPISNQTLFSFDPNTITTEKLDSLAMPQFIKHNLIKYRESGGTFFQKGSFRKLYGMNDSLYHLIENFLVFEKSVGKERGEKKSATREIKPSYQNFDPNMATFEELLSIGFSKSQAGNLLKYRQSGAVFNYKNDLLKIYGIDSVFFKKIEPWIKIDSIRFSETIRKNTNERVLVEINQADSATFVKLYGIGPVLASRIIKYRNLLGGFTNKEQISEVYGISRETFENIKNNIEVDTFYVIKLSLNFSDYNQLVRHPYLMPGQVKKIVEIRNKSGPFVTCKDLISKNILNEEEFEKVRYYLKIN